MYCSRKVFPWHLTLWFVLFFCFTWFGLIIYDIHSFACFVGVYPSKCAYHIYNQKPEYILVYAILICCLFVAGGRVLRAHEGDLFKVGR